MKFGSESSGLQARPKNSLHVVHFVHFVQDHGKVLGAGTMAYINVDIAVFGKNRPLPKS